MAEVLRLREAARLIGDLLDGCIAPSAMARSLRHPVADPASRRW
jgi:hypothetical protein